MQWLATIAERVGRADVEAAELKPWSEHVFHAFQHLRCCNGPLEDLALVDQIRKSPRVRLLLELSPGARPFLHEQLLDAQPKRVQLFIAHQAIENKVPD